MRVGYTSMGACIFAKLGAEALDSLPAWVLEQMGNVEDLVEDLAPPRQPNLLGPYEGVPLSATGEMEPKRRFLDPLSPNPSGARRVRRQKGQVRDEAFEDGEDESGPGGRERGDGGEEVPARLLRELRGRGERPEGVNGYVLISSVKPRLCAWERCKGPPERPGIFIYQWGRWGPGSKRRDALYCHPKCQHGAAVARTRSSPAALRVK